MTSVEKPGGLSGNASGVGPNCGVIERKKRMKKNKGERLYSVYYWVTGSKDTKACISNYNLRYF